MSLNCIYKTKTGETSFLYETLKNYYKEDFDNNKDPKIKKVGDKIETISEHYYHYTFSKEFKDWYGNGELNSQGEPVLHVFDSGGINYAFFKNDKGVTEYINGSKFTGLDINIANEITDQLLYYIFEKLDGIDFEHLSSVKAIKVPYKNIVNGIIKEQGTQYSKFIESSKTPEEKQKRIEAAKKNLSKIRRILVKYENDFSRSIKTKLKSYSIDYQNIELNQDEISEVESFGEVVRKDRGKTNSKDSATANIKMLLSFSVPEVVKTENGNRVAKGVLLGYPKFKRFGSVWNVLEPALSNLPTLIENGDFIDRKKQLIDIVVDKSSIIPGLKVLANKLKALDNDSPVLMQFNKAFDKSKTTYNRASATTEGGTYTTKFITNDRETPVNLLYSEWSNNLADTNYIKKGVIKIDSWLQEYANVKDDLDKLKAHLAKIGIRVSNNAFITINKDSLYGAIALINNSPIKTDTGANINVYAKINNKLNKFATNEAINRGIIGENTVLGPEGLYWIYSNRTFIDTVIDEIKQGDLTYIHKLRGNVYSNNSILFGKNKSDNQIIKTFNNINVQQFLSLQVDSGDAGSDSKNINYYDELVTSINRTLQSVLLEGTSASNMLAPADKPTNLLLSGLPFKQTNGELTNSGSVKILRGYLVDEINAARQNNKDIYFQKGVSESNGIFLFDSLRNLDTLYETVDDKKTLKDPSTFTKEDIEAIDNTIKNELNRTINSYIDEFKDMAGSETIDQIFDKNIVDSYKSKHEKNYIKVMLADFLINGMIANVEMTKLFTGYPGFYKNSVDFFKRVPATQTDGKYLYLTKGDPRYYKIAIVDKIETPSNTIKGYDLVVDENNKVKKVISDYARSIYEVEQSLGRPTSLEEVAEILDDYSKNNIGDAQAWITYDRAKFLAKKLGTWNSSMNEIDTKIQNLESLTAADIKTVGSMFQPQKGVHFEITENGTPVYLKYSQAVLIPSLIKNTGLEQIYTTMKESGVDELITIDGVKAGPGIAETSTGKLQTLDNAIKDKTFTNTKNLENRYWKLQQELPSKKIKTGTLASQIQKNILANILLENTEKIYKFRGESYAGIDIVDMIISTTTELLDLQKQQLFDELGLNGNEDLSAVQNNPKVKQLIIEELSRSNPDNVLEAVEMSDQFDLIPIAREKVQSVLASYFKKRLNDIQMNVGSMIQISNYGTYSLSASKKEGIKWLVDNQTLEGPVIENGQFKSGQVLIPSWLIAEHIPNWKDMSREELLKRVDPKILKVLGFRIPNQGMSSNDSLEVVGILPPEVGDSVYVYNGLTTKTGSDFDIDKMYMLFPNLEKTSKNNFDTLGITRKQAISILAAEGITSYSQEPLKKLKALMFDYKAQDIKFENQKFNDEVFSKFSYTDPNKNKLVYETKGVKGLQNKLLELYLSILESPATYLDLVKSIDKDTSKLKSAIKNENPTKTKLSSIFDPLRQVKIKNDLVKGKRGVGVTANHLVNHIYTQLYNILIDGYDLTKEYDSLNNVKVTGIVSAYLNAFVDIAKDPYVLEGNFINYTMGPSFLLLRSGMNYKTLVKFLSLPIIKELSEQSGYTGSKFFSTPERFKRLNQMAGEASIKGIGIEFTDSEITAVKEGRIPSNLKNEYPDITMSLVLGAYINHFKSLKASASKLTSLIQSTTYEVNGPGRTISRQIATLNKVFDVITNPDIENTDAMFSSDTVLGKRLKNSVLDLLKLESTTFYEARLPDVINKLSEMLIGDRAKTEGDLEKLDKFINSLYTLVYQEILNIDNYDSYFVNAWATELTLLKKRYPKNEFLKLLNYEIHDGRVFYKINNTKNKDTNELNAITQGWRDLMRGPESDFAKKLINKSFIESGFNYSIHSYYHLIPSEFFVDRTNVEQYNIVINKLEKLKNVENVSDKIALLNPYLLKNVSRSLLGQDDIKILRKTKINKLKSVFIDLRSNTYIRKQGKVFKRVGSFELNNVNYSIFKEMENPNYQNNSGFKAISNNYKKTTITLEEINALASDGLIFRATDFNTDFNIVNEISNYLETSKLEIINNSGNNKFTVPNVRFIINPSLRTKTGGKKLASTNNDDLISINPVRSVEEFLAYFKGEVKSETSQQKRKVFDVLSKMGYDEAFFTKLLNSDVKANQWLVYHELSHVKNQDKLVYFNNGEDLMTPDKIDIEVRASIDAIKSIQDLYSSEPTLDINQQNESVENVITPQQKQEAQQVHSQYLESLNKPNTNPILQGNQKEQLNKFKELQERLNNKEFLEGAKFAYEGSESGNTLTPKGTINVYWGQAESNTSTKILSNLAPRKFTWEGREYGSVEHAYQSNKSGTFDKATYDKYVKAGGYGRKIRGKGTVAETKASDSLGLMKRLVVESFKQNSNSEAAIKLLQYENFTHNTNQLIDKAFLEGLKLAQEELLNNNQQSQSLKEFGTQEQYNDYIARVSLGILKNPSSGGYNYTSKVKDIVYRAGNISKEEFDNSEHTPTDYMDLGVGLYISPNIEFAKDYGKPRPILVNIKNPKDAEIAYKERGDEKYLGFIPQLDSDGKFDGIVDLSKKLKETYELVVFKPEQIHILGSKQDINGFKEFVTQPTVKQSVTQVAINKSKWTKDSPINEQQVEINKIKEFYNSLTVNQKKNLKESLNDLIEIYRSSPFQMNANDIINYIKKCNL